MSRRDPFYDQRATEVKSAINSGNIEGAADLIAHLFIEEGSEGLRQVTDAVQDN